MRLPFYTVAVPILACTAFAQDTPPAQPKQTTPAPAAKEQTAPAATPDKPAEVKTQTYAGTLMDASCAGGSAAAPATAAAGSSTPANAGANSADRSAPAAAGDSCSVSSSTTQFALKTKEGTVYRFDDVGNARVQEAMKSKKSWREPTKPIRAKARGIVSGEKLIVVSIN